MRNRRNDDAKQAALEAFINELKRFYAVDCGRPSLRELAKKSEWMMKRYPDRKLQALSPTAISEVLNHRRKSFPTSAWLASLILSCQRCAWELGVIPEDPGFATLPDWHRRLREAREQAEAGHEPPQARGGAGGDGPRPPFPGPSQASDVPKAQEQADDGPLDDGPSDDGPSDDGPSDDGPSAAKVHSGGSGARGSGTRGSGPQGSGARGSGGQGSGARGEGRVSGARRSGAPADGRVSAARRSGAPEDGRASDAGGPGRGDQTGESKREEPAREETGAREIKAPGTGARD
jgi:hypothetical protein